MRRQLWIWPLCAAAVLAVLGVWLRSTVEAAMKKEIANQLQAILNADVAALRIWFAAQEHNVAALAVDQRIRQLAEGLINLADKPGSDRAQLMTAPQQQELREDLKAVLEAQGYAGYVVITPTGIVVAASHDELIGKKNLPFTQSLLDSLLAGKNVVMQPYKSKVILETSKGEMRAGVPTMFALAPVRNAKKEVVGAIGMRIRPEKEFTEILSVARAGATGETYAFNKDGLLLSESRFDDQLKSIGLLTDDEYAQSILTVQLRDPQVNMIVGQRPSLNRKDQPLTALAKGAIETGKAGVDVNGYRDYRGVDSIGAWTWLPDFEMGVGTEVDVAEAFQPLYILRVVFWALFALLALCALVIFVGMILMARYENRMRHAVLEAKQLGQYTLEEELGAGGMGVVYKARHYMLRRPTAVKLLNLEKTNEQSIERFQREVQLTSELNHPNTIAIYDYGRTPEGVFYYAMEYLDGIPLDLLVERFGPQPEGRVVHILQQVCGSLAEAHGIGLIHRDIKPANIVLNQRGGMQDVIKVLDFGLVKAVDSRKEATLTAAGSITGTPQFISPEGIERPATVDARSDLYAVGAVGYFLLTGTPMFDGDTIMELCTKQVRAKPQSVSERLGREVCADLEKLILQCLAKNPDERPQTARELADLLAHCRCAGTWSTDEARAWWNMHANQATRKLSPSGPDTRATDKTVVYSTSAQA